MKKSDLKNGMIVELRNGDRYILINNVLCRNRGCLGLSEFKDDLTDHVNNSSWDIVSVYNGGNNPIRYFNSGDLELIWQRDETDWSKVPFGTKVRVWDFENDDRLGGRFLGYNKDQNHPYNVFVDTTKPKIWKNCELIEEPKEEVTVDEIYDKYRKYLESKGDGFRTNTGEFILQNYNVTRK